MTENYHNNNNSNLDYNEIEEIERQVAERQETEIEELENKEKIPKFKSIDIHIGNDNGNGKKSTKNNKEEDDQDNKNDYPINKYSQGIPLAESILVNYIPYFIQIIDGKPVYKPKIELSDINIVPPQRTEYLSKEYSFASFEEVQYFIDLAKQETLDSLKTLVKTILQKYIDIDDDFINILTADIIFTYFQDRLKMTHYLLIVGDNNTGKSNILLVFSFLGYRPILDTAITPANIYNFGSHLEDGQCIILEDEIDDIDDQPDKKKYYKSSYRAGVKVTRIYDNNSSPVNSKRKSSRQNGFFLFGFKMFASEKMPDKIKSKGFLERIIPLKAVSGDPSYDISEVVDESGDEQFKKLYEELMNTRKLLLMYRLLHYDETIPDIKLNIKNRYKQLTKPVMRLFQNTASVDEITSSLSKYLIEKNQEKIDSIDSAILTFIINLVSKYGEILYNNQIWDELKKKYPNGELPDNPYSWYLEGYGRISKSGITQICEIKFGAKQHRDSVNGRGLIFNQNKLNKTAVNYSIIEGIKIIKEEKKSYDTNDRNDASSEYPDKDSIDNITKNATNKTDITQDQEQLIPQNNNITTKNTTNTDTKTNEHSLEVSYQSYVSCHYCSYQGKSENEVLNHSINSHPGIPARPDKSILKLMKIDDNREPSIINDKHDDNDKKPKTSDLNFHTIIGENEQNEKQ
jgi:hypothetical protein